MLIEAWCQGIPFLKSSRGDFFSQDFEYIEGTVLPHDTVVKKFRWLLPYARQAIVFPHGASSASPRLFWRISTGILAQRSDAPVPDHVLGFTTLRLKRSRRSLLKGRHR